MPDIDVKDYWWQPWYVCESGQIEHLEDGDGGSSILEGARAGDLFSILSNYEMWAEFHRSSVAK